MDINPVLIKPSLYRETAFWRFFRFTPKNVNTRKLQSERSCFGAAPFALQLKSFA